MLSIGAIYANDNVTSDDSQVCIGNEENSQVCKVALSKHKHSLCSVYIKCSWLCWTRVYLYRKLWWVDWNSWRIFENSLIGPANFLEYCTNCATPPRLMKNSEPSRNTPFWEYIYIIPPITATSVSEILLIRFIVQNQIRKMHIVYLYRILL